MRRLILMRHAKSSWKDFNTDHERPLSARGRRDAPRVAARLVELGWEPDRVLYSDSRRTTETWQRMARRFTVEPELDARRSLYLGGLRPLEQALLQTPSSVRTVLALGHNPDWERAVAHLCGRPVRMTTANAALLELPDLPWSDFEHTRGVARLIDLVRPKELGSDE